MMRRFSPPRDELPNVRPRLTPGERRLVDLLDASLEPEWEIYCQPHVNGLKPDVVVLHPRVGIAVFEVKDWDFGAIEYRTRRARRGAAPELVGRRPDGSVFVKPNPIEKVNTYRREIQELYCPKLHTASGLAAITGCLVFPFAEEELLSEILGDALLYQASGAAERYVRLAGRETLESGKVERLLPSAALSSSRLMTPELADDLRHWLVEPDFSAEQRRRPSLDRTQERLIRERTRGGFRRIRGPAGSGKSVVLAGRAAELEKAGKDVLVVAFNHTLLNYLRDTSVRFGCDSRRISWLGFHDWCKRSLRLAGREERYGALWRAVFGTAEDGDGDPDAVDALLREGLPAEVADALNSPAGSAIPRYDAILVDEGQDMLPSWWNLLRQVLRDGGEMVLVADAAQDIYGRSDLWTDQAMRGAGFAGPWVDLSHSYRMPVQLTRLARLFVERYLPAPDWPLPEPPAQTELDVDTASLRWVQAETAELEAVAFQEIRDLVARSGSGSSAGLAFADVVFLCDNTSVGRAITAELTKNKIRVRETFAERSRARKQHKLAFYKGSERVKGTTVHSFKGWEGRSLVVVLAGGGASAARLLYSGITRLKAHPHGSYLTVVCAAPTFAQYGRQWPEFVAARAARSPRPRAAADDGPNPRRTSGVRPGTRPGSHPAFPVEDVEAAASDERLQQANPFERSRAWIEAHMQDREQPACPDCQGNELDWIYFRSPERTWQALCGRAGWLGLCRTDRRQVVFLASVIS